MQQIICICSPFSLYQQIKIITDGLVTEEFNCETKFLANSLVEYAYSKKISNITLRGNKSYLEKFKKDIHNIEQSKYNQNYINLNIIS